MKQKEATFFTETHQYELETIVGKENVITDEAEIDAQSLDVWWVTRFWKFSGLDFPRPFAVVFAENTAQVVRIVQFCNEHRMPLIPRGGGAGDAGGCVALTGGIVLDLKKMDKVLEINEKSLTVRVQPGIIQKHLEEYLNNRGYTMNHFPASFTTSCLGGFISTNGTGVLSSKYGKLSDMVHQLEVVLPNGRLFRSLPVRLHSTGPDYSRLFIGAEGTLGIITEALCKIHRLPEKRLFRAFVVPDLAAGIEAGRRIMVGNLQPCLLRLYDENDSSHILKGQFSIEATGCVLLVGFDGLERLVRVQSEIALEILSKMEGKDLGDGPAVAWWEGRYKSYYPPNDYIAYPWMTAVTDTVASYERIQDIYKAMKSAVEDGFREWNAVFHAHFSHWYDWGTSFYPTFLLKEYPNNPREALTLFNRVMDAAIGASIRNGGVVNEHHGIGLKGGRFMKEIYADGYELARAIKKALDPNNILNPGKLGLGE
ncbi:MAG TPA: FAD-binding oxidoreductase [Spirochaetia bacterium]|nr:FAD-binding oxidoreductase [Spirochaetia bacterium]